MKKVLMSAALATLISGYAVADAENIGYFGLNVGAAITPKFDLDMGTGSILTTKDVKLGTRISFGADVGYQITENIAIEAGLNYITGSGKSVSLKDSDVKDENSKIIFGSKFATFDKTDAKVATALGTNPDSHSYSVKSDTLEIAVGPSVRVAFNEDIEGYGSVKVGVSRTSLELTHKQSVVTALNTAAGKNDQKITEFSQTMKNKPGFAFGGVASVGIDLKVSDNMKVGLNGAFHFAGSPSNLTEVSFSGDKAAQWRYGDDDKTTDAVVTEEQKKEVEAAKAAKKPSISAITVGGKVLVSF